MAIPKDPKKRNHMFSDDMKFLQKAVIYHPNENKFLVLKRSPNEKARPNNWDFPGGNVLFGEDYSDSLTQEIKDETLLKIRDLQPIQVVTNYVDKIYYLFIGYSCKATSKNVKISKEHSEYKWVTVEEFLKLESADFLIDLVKELKLN